MMNDPAYWCGVLSEAIRESTARMPPEWHTVQCLKEALERYDRDSGFPPPGAKIIANVGHEMPLDRLKPGERLINGNIYYSEAWLNDEILSRPALVAGDA